MVLLRTPVLGCMSVYIYYVSAIRSYTGEYTEDFTDLTGSSRFGDLKKTHMHLYNKMQNYGYTRF